MTFIKVAYFFKNYIIPPSFTFDLLKLSLRALMIKPLTIWKKIMKHLFVLLLSFAMFAQFSCVSKNTETFVYFGTYTKKGGSEGIYVSKLNKETGALSVPQLAVECLNPSFVASHPNSKVLYAVTETGGDKAVVTAYTIGLDGKLTKINEQPTEGGAPCHVSVDATGKTLLVANYSGKNCISFPLSNDGSIGKGNSYKHTGRSVTKRQSQPNPHSVNVDPQNKRAFVADLGIDKIVVYNMDSARGVLSKHSALSMPPGGGPRHFSFHPSGKFAYANLELTRQIVAMSYDADKGFLKQLQVLPTVPKEANSKGSTAECLVHPSGKFVYVSNRGHNSIAVFSIDQQSGLLTPVEIEPTQSAIPRGFGIDPSGKFLIVGHQQSDKINVFKINQESGALDFTGNSVSVQSTVNVRFVEK